MSGYLIEPIEYKENFRGTLRIIQNGSKIQNWWFLKQMAVLTHLFKDYGRDLSCSRLLACMSSLLNNSETVKTSKKPQSKSKATRTGQKRWKRVILKGVLTHFFKGFFRYSMCYGFLTSQGTLWSWLNQSETMWGFQRILQNVKNNPKRAKKVNRVIFTGVVVLTHFFHGYGWKSSIWWTPHMSGLPMEPIRDNQDFKGPVRKIHSG